MVKHQLFLFPKMVGKAAQPQIYTAKSPTADSAISNTLHPYYLYLRSGDYSAYTADDFVGDIKKLANYLPQTPLHKITTTDLQDWIATLRSPQGENLAAKTVSRKVTAVKNYFSWLSANQILATNPALQLIPQRITSPLPEILFDHECQLLLKTANQNSRTYLLIFLLLETGIKKAELFNLKINHFDFSNRYQPTVWIRHKGKQVKKDRQIKLPSEIISVFDDYVHEYQIEETLFPYTARTIHNLITDTAIQTGINKKVTAQILRDTFAVNQLKNGTSLFRVGK